MVIKFKNPKTGEVLPPDEAFNKFCVARNCCGWCPLGSFPGTWEDCETWMRNNIEKTAEVMVLKVVREDEKTLVEKSVGLNNDNLNNAKPKICEILGVEPGESFYIQGFDGVLFWIMDDGTFTTQPNNAPGSSMALLQTLDHPERVEHLPHWSPDEVALARMFLDACYDKESVFFARTGNGTLYWSVEFEGRDLRENILPMCLFPQIKCGQKVYLRDIVGESRSEEDEI